MYYDTGTVSTAAHAAAEVCRRAWLRLQTCDPDWCGCCCCCCMVAYSFNMTGW
jgi:hypothetical protein